MADTTVVISGAIIKAFDNGDGSHSVAAYEPPSSYSNIAAAGTVVVKSGAGVLKRIVVNKTVALSVTTIYDNTAASGTKIGTITQPAALLTSNAAFPFDCKFNTGLTIVTSLGDDITVVYR